MWVHLPELSINLAMVLRVIPTAEGKIQVVQADNTTLTIDGPKADAICQCLATLPNGNMKYLVFDLEATRRERDALKHGEDEGHPRGEN